MIDGEDTIYLLLYNYSDQPGFCADYLIKNNIDVKYAYTESEAIEIAGKYKIGVFLAFYHSNDLSPIYALRQIMKHYPYIQRFLLSSNINSEMMELAINKAHINYFLPLPSEKITVLSLIKKAFKRFDNVRRIYERLGKFADVTMELVEDIEKYYEEANKDALTSLLNRRSFDNILNRLYNHFKKKKIPFVLALIDLDKFKDINDTYGHTAGDLVLQKFSSTMKSCSRLGEDFVFRYGGEEFAILSHGNSDIEMSILLHRLKHQIKQMQIEFQGKQIELTFSAGVAVMKKKYSVDRLLSNADAALYYAKKNGRNLIVTYKKKLIDNKQ